MTLVVWLGVDRSSRTAEKSAVAGGSGSHSEDATTADQSVYAVLSMDHFTLLRSENDYSISVLQQLDAAAALLSHQVVLYIHHLHRGLLAGLVQR